MSNQFMLGSTFRGCRLIGFATVSWLLTRCWGRCDYPLLRAHITCLRILICSVLIGAVVAPVERSPARVASPARFGQSPQLRSPTTLRCCWDALRFCGSAERCRVEQPC
jgi:hypothetical protein